MISRLSEARPAQKFLMSQLVDSLDYVRRDADGDRRHWGFSKRKTRRITGGLVQFPS
jgi:hypothetical protein